MKARVKATGKIVEVRAAERNRMYCDYDFIDIEGLQYDADELEYELEYEPDYWTRLKHQAAIAAMQGLIASNLDLLSHEIIEDAIQYAHALVEKMKEEEEK